MDDTIITIYCLCEEFLEATGHWDDPQVRLSTAEVITVPLVSFLAQIGPFSRPLSPI